MIVLAVVTFLGYLLIAVGLATFGVAFLQDPDRESGTAVGIGVAATVVVAAVAALFIWLAVMVRRGRNWARITATVLLTLAIVSTVGNIVVDLLADPIVIPIFDVIQLWLMVSALVLLWGSQPARGYFAAPAAPGIPGLRAGLGRLRSREVGPASRAILGARASTPAMPEEAGPCPPTHPKPPHRERGAGHYGGCSCC